MKLTAPNIDQRPEQHYLSIRTWAAPSELGQVIPQLNGEVATYMSAQGIAPAGPSFIRYNVINMEDKMDIELGTPVASSAEGNGRVEPGSFPAGRYAALVYTGIQNGIPANAALIEWAANNGINWDRWDDPNGDAFAARYERFLTGPDEDPDPGNWDTEVAIKVVESEVA